MKWNKVPIDLKDIPALTESLRKDCQAGAPILENMRCAFKLKDEAIIHLYTVFDWIDAKIDPEKIEKYYIYQPLNG